MTEFSVLMSIYAKEDPRFFDRALRSIFDEQTEKPAEVIVVKDGTLTPALEQVLDGWREKLGPSLRVYGFDVNRGLGEALNLGLRQARHEIVARMDTDDIAHPDRFAAQLGIMGRAGVDVCGSWVSEFEEEEDFSGPLRKVPETHEDIARFSKYRNPINHPSVMFRRSVVEAAGSYRPMPWFEDYYLWCRLLGAGARFHNIPKPLVRMRAGRKFIQRRRGLKYAIAEFRFWRALYEAGLIGFGNLALAFSTRAVFRLLPTSLLSRVYWCLRPK